jgi:hypothetical protein
MEWNKAMTMAMPAKGMYFFSEPDSVSIIYSNRKTPIIRTAIPETSFLNMQCDFQYSTAYLTTYKDVCDTIQPDDLVEAFTKAMPFWFGILFINNGWRCYEPLKKFYNVIYKTENEVVLELNQRHLNCKVSVLLTKPRKEAMQKNMILSTTIAFHDTIGRLYFLMLKPIYENLLLKVLQHLQKYIQA